MLLGPHKAVIVSELSVLTLTPLGTPKFGQRLAAAEQLMQSIRQEHERHVAQYSPQSPQERPMPASTKAALDDDATTTTKAAPGGAATDPALPGTPAEPTPATLGRLAHFEPMSNGVHSTDRPRGLIQQLFGPGGTGWLGLAAKVCTALAAHSAVHGATDLVLWAPLGVETTSTRDQLDLSDRPSLTAAGLPVAWRNRLLDRDAFAAAMARLRLALRGGTIWAYIGAPRQAEPDPFLLAMVEAGVVQGVIFDATALTRHPFTMQHMLAYKRRGARIAYEAVTKVGMREMWTDPDLTCCASITTWINEQANAAPHAMHTNRPVPALAMTQPLLLLDQHGATPIAINDLLTRHAFPTTVATDLTKWRPTTNPNTAPSES